MEYKNLAKLYNRLESTTKRLEKTAIIADFLKKTDTKLLPIVTLLLLGRVFPTWSEEELGIGSKLLMKAISTVTGVSVDEIEEKIREEGDIGKASEVLFKRKVQATFTPHPLTVKKVYKDLRKLASITGPGAQSKKINILLGILSLASPIEAKYITRTILEELRVGAGEGIISDAISLAFNIDKEVVERAYMLT
ncbi:MAG TPA: DNA ligase, partial [Methanothermobacter sp.]|nr:DNA ligase [Methanothermobacter sp.]